MQRTGPGNTFGHHKYQNTRLSRPSTSTRIIIEWQQQVCSPPSASILEWGCWEPIHLLAIKASSSLLIKVFKASTPSFAFPYTTSFLRWSQFRQIRFFAAFFSFCAGRISDRSDSSLPSFLVLVTSQRDPILHCLPTFLPSHLPLCAGRTANRSVPSLPSSPFVLATFQQIRFFITVFPSCASRIFWTWDGAFQFNSMASGIPDDGKPPCFHMMHAGKPLSSHGYPRPFDETFHGKPFRIYAQKDRKSVV